MSRSLNLEALERAAEAKGLTQTRIADALSVSREAVSNWFSGESFPRPDKLLRLGLALGLSHAQLVKRDETSEPIIAFRAANNRKTTEAHIKKAQGMGRLLSELVPYLPFDKFAQPRILKAPVGDYDYLQQVAKKIRSDVLISERDSIDFTHLIRCFGDLQAVLIPTLWGSKNRHENATHVYLPDSMTTWVYLNLDVKVHDFKFWMAHELGHAMASQLRGDEGEDFADGLAGALLFPEGLAHDAYIQIASASKKAQISRIVDIADSHTISPITVYIQINAYAERHKKPQLELAPSIYAATTAFNKRFALVSESIFDGGEITPALYIKSVANLFDTPFFEVLSKHLQNSSRTASFVHSVLDIGLIDAKGIYAELT